VLRIADDFGVPPSYIRSEMSFYEIQQWAEYQEIKQEEFDQMQADAAGED